MSDEDEPNLAVAEEQSEQARKRLAGTLVDIQARLNPKALAREAAQEIREAGQELVHGGLATAKRHRLTLAGVGAAMGLLVLRRPLRKLFRRKGARAHAKRSSANTR